jgi:hypothetical protein
MLQIFGCADLQINLERKGGQGKGDRGLRRREGETKASVIYLSSALARHLTGSSRPFWPKSASRAAVAGPKAPLAGLSQVDLSLETANLNVDWGEAEVGSSPSRLWGQGSHERQARRERAHRESRRTVSLLEQVGRVPERRQEEV